jgi:Na+-translocating ferredoxin:NAD+ oxidoreductase RnfG subunit
MNRTRISLIAVLAVALLLRAGFTVLFPEQRVDESQYLDEVAPGVLFEEKSGSPPHYASVQGVVAFNTYGVTPGIRGYAGPIRLLLALDPQGRIAGIRILEHEETPNYVHAMETPSYLQQFLGKSVNDPFVPDRDIDGVSRATVSVKALADTVRESSREVASRVMGIEVRGAEGGQVVGVKWIAYAVLLLAALVIYFVTRRRRLPDAVRDVVLVLGIFVVGVWLSTPFSIIHVFNLLLARFSTDPLWLAIVPGTIATIALAGRFYCGWLCPFGAISEFLGRLRMRKWSVPTELDDRWRNVKYYLLALAVLVAIPIGKTGFANYETYVTLFSLHGTYIMWVVIALNLIANLRVKRFWCRFLCPVGALAGLASRKDIRYVSSPDCPMANKPVPLIAECIRCNRCYAAAGKRG